MKSPPSYFAYNEMRLCSTRARLLNQDQKRELLEAIQTRDRLTNKALAARFGLKLHQISDQIRRLREQTLGAM